MDAHVSNAFFPHPPQKDEQCSRLPFNVTRILNLPVDDGGTQSLEHASLVLLSITKEAILLHFVPMR